MRWFVLLTLRSDSYAHFQRSQTDQIDGRDPGHAVLPCFSQFLHGRDGPYRRLFEDCGLCVGIQLIPGASFSEMLWFSFAGCSWILACLFGYGKTLRVNLILMHNLDSVLSWAMLCHLSLIIFILQIRLWRAGLKLLIIILVLVHHSQLDSRAFCDLEHLVRFNAWPRSCVRSCRKFRCIGTEDVGLCNVFDV